MPPPRMPPSLPILSLPVSRHGRDHLTVDYLVERNRRSLLGQEASGGIGQNLRRVRVNLVLPDRETADCPALFVLVVDVLVAIVVGCPIIFETILLGLL